MPRRLLIAFTLLAVGCTHDPRNVVDPLETHEPEDPVGNQHQIDRAGGSDSADDPPRLAPRDESSPLWDELSERFQGWCEARRTSHDRVEFARIEREYAKHLVRALVDQMRLDAASKRIQFGDSMRVGVTGVEGAPDEEEATRIRSLLDTLLSAESGIRQVERASLDRVLGELERTRGDEFDPEHVSRLGKLIGADVLLFVRLDGGNVHLRLTYTTTAEGFGGRIAPWLGGCERETVSFDRIASSKRAEAALIRSPDGKGRPFGVRTKFFAVDHQVAITVNKIYDSGWPETGAVASVTVEALHGTPASFDISAHPKSNRHSFKFLDRDYELRATRVELDQQRVWLCLDQIDGEPTPITGIGLQLERTWIPEGQRIELLDGKVSIRVESISFQSQITGSTARLEIAVENRPLVSETLLGSFHPYDALSFQGPESRDYVLDVHEVDLDNRRVLVSVRKVLDYRDRTGH